MEDLKGLIPKNKFETDKVNSLASREPEEIELILPELMEWLQDINWPVARELSKMLPSCGARLIPHIRRILNGSDEQWKFSLLVALIRNIPTNISIELEGDIRRIMTEPTKGEKLEELDELAEETIEFIHKQGL